MQTTARVSRSRASAWLFALLLFVSLAIILSSGCGSKPDEQSSGEPAGEPAATPSTGAPADTVAQVTATAESAGDKIFATKCALCHGPSGHGDGVASKALNPKPRNFHDATYMSGRTDDQLLEVIREGKGAMPAWGKSGALTEAQMRSVLAHIRGFAGTP
jgi:mono/diheme cytochrome c family protein